MTTEELIAELHQHLGEQLLKRIKSGEATSGEFAAAIKWLKDQNCYVNMANENPPTQHTGPSLVEGLPFHDENFKDAQ